MPSESLSDVLSATLGYSVQSSKVWDGLFVNDPFKTAKSVVSIVVEGVDDLSFKVRLHISKYNYKITFNPVIAERKDLQSDRR